MIAMALLTHSAKGFAAQVGTLPGSAQVSMQAAGSEGILLSEVGAVSLGRPVLELRSNIFFAAWHRQGEWLDREVVYRRRHPGTWEPEQLVAGGRLVGFRLDANEVPCVAVWGQEGPGELVFMRHQ
jgi:hypothetical protein